MTLQRLYEIVVDSINWVDSSGIGLIQTWGMYTPKGLLEELTFLSFYRWLFPFIVGIEEYNQHLKEDDVIFYDSFWIILNSSYIKGGVEY